MSRGISIKPSSPENTIDPRNQPKYHPNKMTDNFVVDASSTTFEKKIYHPTLKAVTFINLTGLLFIVHSTKKIVGNETERKMIYQVITGKDAINAAADATVARTSMGQLHSLAKLYFPDGKCRVSIVRPYDDPCLPIAELKRILAPDFPANNVLTMQSKQTEFNFPLP